MSQVMEEVSHLIEHQDIQFKLENREWAEEAVHTHKNRFEDVDLSTVHVEWQDMGRTAGRASYSSDTLKLNPNMLEKAPYRLHKTIIHELAHFASYKKHGEDGKGHGMNWKAEMRLAGIENPERCHPITKLSDNYVLRCSNPDCSKEYGRKKKSKKVKFPWMFNCGRCNARLENKTPEIVEAPEFEYVIRKEKPDRDVVDVDHADTLLQAIEKAKKYNHFSIERKEYPPKGFGYETTMLAENHEELQELEAKVREE